MYSDYYDDIDMHTETLERCRRAHNYRVIEIHIPGIQGPGVSSGGGDTSDPDDDVATDDDIQDLFPSNPDGGDKPTNPDDEGGGDIATDDDILDLFPGTGGAQTPTNPDSGDDEGGNKDAATDDDIQDLFP